MTTAFLEVHGRCPSSLHSQFRELNLTSLHASNTPAGMELSLLPEWVSCLHAWPRTLAASSTTPTPPSPSNPPRTYISSLRKTRCSHVAAVGFQPLTLRLNLEFDAEVEPHYGMRLGRWAPAEMRGARDDVCAGAGAGRPECLSSEVPQAQWDLVMRSVSLTGEMLSVDPMTAVMDLRIDLGIIVRPIPSYPCPSSCFSGYMYLPAAVHGWT